MSRCDEPEEWTEVSDIAAECLLKTTAVAIRDVSCRGSCSQRGPEEHVSALHLAFPYRGLFVRHVARDDAVAEANQLLFFNPSESYYVSHPVPGGDASLDLVVSDPLLRELSPRTLLRDGPSLAFRVPRVRIDPNAQSLVALLRHRLRRDLAERLEAESLALTLVRRALGPRTSHAPAATAGRRRLVDRTKLVLAGDLTRRWTLRELGAEVGHSPVYLTQVFQQVEGVPLYRYQRQLRLARALELMPHYDDLTALGLDLGFSSHSHFATAFRHMYGRSPSAFRRAARHR